MRVNENVQDLTRPRLRTEALSFMLLCHQPKQSYVAKLKVKGWRDLFNP